MSLVRSKSKITRTLTPLSSIELDHVARQHKQQLRQLIESHRDLFVVSSKDLGSTDLIKMQIDTGNTLPISSRLYRVPLSQQKVVDEHVKEMLDNGIIRHSRSAWSSLVVLVVKKDKSIRFCVDYRILNKVTVNDSFPLPIIDDVIAKLAGAKYKSSIDLCSAY